MENLKAFEWYRNTSGYRLAWMPRRGKKAFWITQPADVWGDEKQVIERNSELHISTTEYQGEKRIANSGIYIADLRQTVHPGKTDEIPLFEAVHPFQSDDLVSLNLLRTAHSPQGWLDFTNKYGMIGHRPILDRWHMGEKKGQWRIYEVEHEGEWHHLTGVLSRIYQDYQAIKKRDSVYLSKIIKWDSDNVVREDRGLTIAGEKIRPSIAMRGRYRNNPHYFEHMKRPDVFVPAAFSIRDHVNRYLEKSLSLEISFDPKSL